MAAQLTCPHCQSTLKTNKPMPGGLEVLCPKCKAFFKVPAGGIKPAKVAASAGARAAVGAASTVGQASAGNGTPDSHREELESAADEAAPDKGLRLVAVAGGGVVLLAVSVLLAVWAFSGRTSDAGNVEAPKEKKEDKPAGLNLDASTASGNAQGKEKFTSSGLIKLTEEEAKLVFNIKDKGLKFLRNAPEGNLNHVPLIGLTLLECGVPAGDPKVQKAAKVTRNLVANSTDHYVISFGILFLDRLNDAQDKALIRTLALKLMLNQHPRGSWDYSIGLSLTKDEEDVMFKLLTDLGKNSLTDFAAANPDRMNALPAKLKDLAIANIKQPADFFKDDKHDTNSHAQFGVLALWAARRHKIPVDQSVQLVAARFRHQQHADGFWYYKGATQYEDDKGRSMTCAGLYALAVEYALDVPHPFKKPSEDPAIQKALKFLGGVIKPVDDPKDMPRVFTLWSFERVGVLYQMQKIDGKDWYRWGLKILQDKQNKSNGSWDFGAEGYGTQIDTCFALLFLQQANLAVELSEEIKRLDFGDPIIGEKKK